MSLHTRPEDLIEQPEVPVRSDGGRGATQPLGTGNRRVDERSGNGWPPADAVRPPSPTRLARTFLLLLLETAFGGVLLVFGTQIAAQEGVFAAVPAMLAVIANALVLGLFSGLDKLGRGQCVLFVAGVLAGGTAACAGAALALLGPGWQVLTLAGILANMELAHLPARMPSAGGGARHCCSG